MAAQDLTAKGALELAGREGLLEALRDQLQKDFNRAGVPFPNLDAASPQQWISLLRETLYRLLMEHSDQYMNLMYAVDIPEGVFRQIPLTDPVEVAEAGVELVLRREWVKVQYRQGRH
ncbi:hypothetical protein OZ410_01990 [Robiginitalea sp. M366]|uniref:hypothetical protein n=1 Tax=Robiginitalea aestuariiviva TaxID=3036903 RepID=UPI00240DA831|nr:hypothetical protein [Robiginitalea aestuariiviva]MDG1571070.1 hypothetical protein [Robiginitalea aestuariiviva]